jgi:hypothetical protein
MAARPFRPDVGFRRLSCRHMLKCNLLLSSPSRRNGSRRVLSDDDRFQIQQQTSLNELTGWRFGPQRSSAIERINRVSCIRFTNIRGLPCDLQNNTKADSRPRRGGMRHNGRPNRRRVPALLPLVASASRPANLQDRAHRITCGVRCQIQDSFGNFLRSPDVAHRNHGLEDLQAVQNYGVVVDVGLDNWKAIRCGISP